MFDAVAYLGTPPYLPFAVALGLMVGLAVLEAVGVGLSAASDALALDADFGADLNADWAAGPLSLAGVGRVPLGVLVVTLLLTFGVGGAALQRVATHVYGQPLAAWAAALAVLVPALLVNGVLAKGLAKVLPKDESTAVSTASFLGQRAVMQGTATGQNVARAELTDAHGQQHYVGVLPHDPDQPLRAGTTVLLVRRHGLYFYAVCPDDLVI